MATIILIKFYTANGFSQNLPGVWHGNAKTPEGKVTL